MSSYGVELHSCQIHAEAQRSAAHNGAVFGEGRLKTRLRQKMNGALLQRGDLDTQTPEVLVHKEKPE